jgi:uncharacterized membrane protein
VKRSASLQSFIEYVRGSLWVMPSVAVIVSVVLGVLVPLFDIDDTWLRPLLFPGGPDGARGMLQAVAGSVITVTSLVFSLTVVTLQLASTQFSPRLLRTFLRLTGNQVVLSIFLSTFVYSLVVLRSVRTADEGGEAFVPALAISLAFLLVLASVGALVFFIHHITSEIRADTLMQRVEGDTLATLDHVHPEPIDRDHPTPVLPDPVSTAVAIPSIGAGIVQAQVPAALVAVAARHGVVVRLAVRIGDRVVKHGVLAWAWGHPDDERLDLPALTDGINGALTIGHERTMQQDVSYGVRQLVDMAAKALSTGMNDPTTAVDAVGHLASIISTIARRRVGDAIISDDSGAPRLFLPQRSFDDYLVIAVSQVRRYGSNEPDVVCALLNLLREAAEAAVDQSAADVIARELELIVEAAQANIEQPADMRAVDAGAQRVRAALDGSRFARLSVTSKTR